MRGGRGKILKFLATGLAVTGFAVTAVGTPVLASSGPCLINCSSGGTTGSGTGSGTATVTALLNEPGYDANTVSSNGTGSTTNVSSYTSCSGTAANYYPLTITWMNSYKQGHWVNNATGASPTSSSQDYGPVANWTPNANLDWQAEWTGQIVGTTITGYTTTQVYELGWYVNQYGRPVYGWHWVTVTTPIYGAPCSINWTGYTIVSLSHTFCSPSVCMGYFGSYYNPFLTSALEQYTTGWSTGSVSSYPDYNHIIVYNPTTFYLCPSTNQCTPSPGENAQGYHLPTSPTEYDYATYWVPIPNQQRQIEIGIVVQLQVNGVYWTYSVSGANSGAGYTQTLYSTGYTSPPVTFTTDATNLHVSVQVDMTVTATVYWRMNNILYSQQAISPTPVTVNTVPSSLQENGMVQQIQGSGCSSNGCG